MGKTEPVAAQGPPTLSRQGVWTRLKSVPREVIAAAALLVLYLSVYSGRFYSPDGMLMFRQAEALVFDHSIHLEHPVWGFGPIRESAYGIGLSLVYAPFVALTGLFVQHAPTSPTLVIGGQADWAFYTQELYHDPIYRFIAPIHIVIAVAAVWMVARLVLAFGFGRREALWAMAFCGVASPWLIYSRGDFAQPLEGLCWVAAFLCALKRGRGAEAGLAFAVFYAILTRPVEGSMLAAVCLVLVIPRWSVTIATAVGGATGIAATVLVDLARFGWPIHSGYPSDVGWTASPAGLAGLLWSPARGLIWWFPALLLAPVGFVVLWRFHRRLAASIGLASIALFLSSGFWSVWWGGLDWGPRLMLPGIPVLAALAGIGMTRVPSPVGIAAAAVGFLTCAPALILDIFRGYGTQAGTPSGSFDWLNYPPNQFLTWLQHRSATDILGRPLLHGDVDIYWAHVSEYKLVLAVAVLAELALLFVFIRGHSSRLRDRGRPGGRLPAG